MRVRALRTLFARTGLTLAVALAMLLLLTGVIVNHYILQPVGQRAADDLAALLVVSAQTWVELPPATRPDFEDELREQHGLHLGLEEPDASHDPITDPYILFLERSLSRRLGREVPVHRFEHQEGTWYAVHIPVAGRDLHLAFAATRLGARPPQALLLIAMAGAGAVLLTSLLLVRHVTRPLERLSTATGVVAAGRTLEPLPETGPEELATLARHFNHMSREVRSLLENRTTLLAGLSHDLRTPLARMALSVEMLADESDPDLVARLRRDIEEMNRLVSQVLELAHGLDRREGEDLDLRELVDGVVADHRHAGGVIDWHPGGRCPLRVPPVALRRVLDNLLDNARRYGGEGPIEVVCQPVATGIAVEVRDRGPGIPADQRERMFLPFTRLEGSRSRATGGSGLGLAIARQLCDAQGWELSLLDREGGGLRARVELPRGTTSISAVAARADGAADRQVG
jgi:two-component system osmolarity sensor histidine kinase EnvZ